jgi:hypothetical protein
MTFIVAGIALAVLLPAGYLGLAATAATDITTITAYVLAISFLGNAAYGPVLIFLNERFPTGIRASGTGVAWNAGFALGGTMPALVSWVSTTQVALYLASWLNPAPPQIVVSLSVFIVVILLIYLLGALLIPESKDDFR